MKFGRLSVMAAVFIMTAGIFAGVVGTSTASAYTSNPTPLCIDSSTVGNDCIYNANVLNYRAFWSIETISTWYYPNTNYETGAIKSGSGDVLCLQINNSDSNFVRYANCSASDSEKWINYYNPHTHRTEFVSYWALYDSTYGYLCLSEDYNGGNRYVKADPCSPGGGTNYWYQQFGTS
jgi:hypothetical protein